MTTLHAEDMWPSTGEKATFYTKMTDMERAKFVKENMRHEARHDVYRKSRSMSRDRDTTGNPGDFNRLQMRVRKDRHHSQDRDERPPIKEKNYLYRNFGGFNRLHTRVSEEVRGDMHHSHERRKHRGYRDENHDGEDRNQYWPQINYVHDKEESNKYKNDGSHSRNNEPFQNHKKEMPCKYFNDTGFCRYNNGYPDQFGNVKLHICSTCYVEYGRKEDHSQVNCKPISRVKREPCKYFNKFGNCFNKSGHLSQDGKYARIHVCSDCFNDYGEKFHPAIDCKYRPRKKLRKDSPSRETLKLKTSEEPDEKPCSFYNNTGDCRWTSGHLSRVGFTKQRHICSCCLELRNEVRHHPAVTCSLKKKLTGGRNQAVSGVRMELPCHSYNAGKCALKSGHLCGLTEMVHICKFCFEYRGENNYHNVEGCKLKKKLLLKIQNECQTEKYGHDKEHEIDETNKNLSYERRKKYVHGKEQGRDMLEYASGHEKREATDAYLSPKENIDKGDSDTDGENLTPRKLNGFVKRLVKKVFKSEEFLQLKDAKNMNVNTSGAFETPRCVELFKEPDIFEDPIYHLNDNNIAENNYHFEINETYLEAMTPETKMTSYEGKLAKETWQQILMDVPPGDLCKVLRTSKYMNSVASWAGLWKGMRVNMGKVRVEGLAQLYSIDRYKKIEKMDFSEMIFTSEELELLLTEIPGSPLQNLNFFLVNLGEVPADLLAQAVSRLRKVNLSFTSLTTTQCVQVLEASISSNSLANVNLVSVNLSEVPADLLARAVSRLKTLNLSAANLTTTQLESVDLSEVPADLLAPARSRLRKVILSYTRLTTTQCVKVLEASTSSNSLANVNLVSNNLSEVPAHLLAREVSRLSKVILSYTRLTTTQCVKVLEASISSNSLANVGLVGVDLSEVPADLLARAVSHLKTLSLSVARLTAAQFVQVLQVSTSSNSSTKLTLVGANLGELQADQLARAVSRLSTVIGMTTAQCVKVLQIRTSSNPPPPANLEGVNAAFGNDFLFKNDLIIGNITPELLLSLMS